LIDVLGVHPDRCPCCGGPLHREVIEPRPYTTITPPVAIGDAYWDTS
jgi:hypothetical protein